MAHDPAARPSELTLEEKVRLLTGRTGWTLHGSPAVGLLPVTMSDGPVGVRGDEHLQHEHSANTPNPTAIAATWDEELTARVAGLFAAEARRQGVDVVLAPVLNLHRSPLGGRHFECFSEDPLLTGRIGAAFVRALQAAGVAACPKHFIGNETETERTSYTARIGERTLREVYLPPFEDALAAGAWTVMAAYNGYDDGTGAAPATEHRGLLTGLLKQELGFDGVVVSDWMAARSTAPTAHAGLDLVMPGPLGPWGDALVRAVRAGEVPEAAVDDKVQRLLRLAGRVGRLDGATAPAPPEPDEDALLREVAARGQVLLRNEGRLLPLDPARLRRVALIGPNALDPCIQGGGSAHVSPKRVATPAEALRAALPDGVELTVHRGCRNRRHLPDADPALLRRLTVELYGADGEPAGTPEAAGPAVHLDVADPRARRAVVSAVLRLEEPGVHRVGAGSVGVHRIEVDGEVVASGEEPASAADVLESRHTHPGGGDALIEVGAEPREVAVVVRTHVADFGDFGRGVVARLRHLPPGPAPEEEMAAAAAAARAADVAVLVVGTDDETESEGYDRSSLDLPGDQDELVRRVLAANPAAVVAVNAGAPVLLPWLEDAPAVLWTWMGGQAYGPALADVLTGAAEPAGRLPWTLPAAAADVPVPDTRPRGGAVDYTEGVFIGHRAYDRAGTEPAREFGFGLGYTDWEIRGAELEDAGAVPPAGPLPAARTPLVLRVRVANTGPRDGRHVVQAYLEPPRGGGPDRPHRTLAGFAAVHLPAGEEAEVRIEVRPRALAVWDAPTRGWTVPPGRYRLAVGSSSRAIAAHVPLEVPGA